MRLLSFWIQIQMLHGAIRNFSSPQNSNVNKQTGCACFSKYWNGPRTVTYPGTLCWTWEIGMTEVSLNLKYKRTFEICQIVSRVWPVSPQRRPGLLHDVPYYGLWHCHLETAREIFHTFKYQNRQTLNTFSLKPHLIFYMYNDAKLLEVKSLQDNKRFECSIQGKIKLNLNLFYWLKSYINQ